MCSLGIFHVHVLDLLFADRASPVCPGRHHAPITLWRLCISGQYLEAFLAEWVVDWRPDCSSDVYIAFECQADPAIGDSGNWLLEESVQIDVKFLCPSPTVIPPAGVVTVCEQLGVLNCHTHTVSLRAVRRNWSVSLHARISVGMRPVSMHSSPYGNWLQSPNSGHQYRRIRGAVMCASQICRIPSIYVRVSQTCQKLTVCSLSSSKLSVHFYLLRTLLMQGDACTVLLL
ncbi:hypothetical protein SELMODRAFT_431778 [Selaginella moellendorffii]|uniref:Uncharacterized protein n=1 Tax=Selaginella moellendorffii TaxID=88036 RepID=D8TDS1_SELML|nr:hypothetical protein SELMODRAFT_431778 [Selaginella moellendorffii]